MAISNIVYALIIFIAVFSISIISILKTFMNMSKENKTIDWRTFIFLGIGGVLGGILGETNFTTRISFIIQQVN